MIDDRPVLIGMTNPYGADPGYALYPLPARATGWRVWDMLSDAVPGGVSMIQYVIAFDRRNLVTGGWSARKAAIAATAMREDLWGRTVLVLGAGVRDAFGLGGIPYGSDSYLRPEAVGDASIFTYWHWLPHPSGRNLWYNDPANRVVAGRLLARLYAGERGQFTVG